MKFTILQKEIKKGLAIIEKISVKSLTLPILNNILLKTEKNFLNISATDLEIAIKWWGLAKVDREGATIIPTKVLTNLLNFLPSKQILFELKNNVLFLSCENYFNQINGQNVDDFPIIPEVPQNEKFIISLGILVEALGDVVNIVSASNIKPELMGVFFKVKKDLIKIVATDSFRLIEKKIYLQHPLDISQEYSFILPPKAVKQLIFIKEEAKEIFIYPSANQILFETFMEGTKHPEIQIISRLIEGEYPNYEEILPQKLNTEIVINKDLFLNHIRVASLFSPKTNEIKLKVNLSKKEIEIVSKNIDVGEHSSSFAAEIKGETREINFNYRFLIDGIEKIKTKDVFLGLSEGDGPAIIKPSQGEDYIYLIMPIKES